MIFLIFGVFLGFAREWCLPGSGGTCYKKDAK